MKLFLDTSVVISACGSTTGASFTIFSESNRHDWTLHTSSYVIKEVRRNLVHLPYPFQARWLSLEPQLKIVGDILTSKWPTVFTPTKDRPILFTALASSDVLLTLDRRDFIELLGPNFYGLRIQKPGQFLEFEKSARRWK